jgi:hypothetical protein
MIIPVRVVGAGLDADTLFWAVRGGDGTAGLDQTGHDVGVHEQVLAQSVWVS